MQKLGMHGVMGIDKEGRGMSPHLNNFEHVIQVLNRLNLMYLLEMMTPLYETKNTDLPILIKVYLRGVDAAEADLFVRPAPKESARQRVYTYQQTNRELERRRRHLNEIRAQRAACQG